MPRGRGWLGRSVAVASVVAVGAGVAWWSPWSASEQELPLEAGGVAVPDAEAGQWAAPDFGTPTLTEVDPSAAMELAVASGEVVEVLSRREPGAELFALPDRTWQLRQWLAPVWVQVGGDGDAVEDWAALDLTLEASEGGLVPGAHPMDVTVADVAGSQEALVRWVVPDSEVVVELWVPGASAVPASVEGARARYAGIAEGVDLVVDVMPTGFEQFFVVHSREALESVGWVLELEYRVQGGGLREGLGGLEVVDGLGEAVGVIPLPFGWDASQDPLTAHPVLASWAPQGENPAAVVGPDLPEVVDLSWTVSTERTVSTAGEVTRVGVEVPAEWAQEASTVFPLVIDPVAYTPYFGSDMLVRSNYPNNNYSTLTEFIIGKDPSYGHVLWSFLGITTTGFKNQDVISANMYAWNYWSATCTQVPWYAYWTATPSTATTWNNMPSVYAGPVVSTHTRGHTSGTTPYCAQDWAWVDITSYAQAWSTHAANSQGILLKAADDTAVQWKRFYSIESSSSYKPHISVWLNQLPGTPSAASYTAPTDTAQGRLAASVTDPDGGTVRAAFTVERRVAGSGAVWEVMFDKNLGSSVTSGQVSVLDVDLIGGFEYRISAYGYDGRKYSVNASASVTVAPGSTSVFQDVPATGDGSLG